MKLNPSQSVAASHVRGPCLVLSGPGSGKTTVITNRVVRLVRDVKVPPDRILVVTFTRTAAEEMKRRYLRLTNEERTAVTFGTFHSVFFRMLRSEYRFGEGNIIEGEAKIRALADVLLSVDPKIEPDREFLTGLINEISFVKNNRIDISEYQTKNPRIDFKTIYEAFNAGLKKAGALDYDDMLLLTYRMLTERPEVLAFWRARFQYILIDEFQDINKVQFDVVKLLAAPENNLFAVGDDDQSIYGFRGAKPEIMLRFPKTFPHTKTVLLDANYRSAPEIVRVSLSMIGHNNSRFKKKLRSESGRSGFVERRLFQNDGEECEAVLSSVNKRLSEGVPLHESAVLARTNAGTSVIVQKCIEAGVPFVTRDKIPNMFMQFYLKPLFACLNWISGNHTRRNFLLFMNCPNRYFRREDLLSDEVDLEALEEHYREMPERKWMADRIAYFRYQLDLMARLAVPFSTVNFFRKAMGYDEYLKELSEKKAMDYGEIEKTMDAVQATARPYETTADWYKYIAKYSRELREREEKSPSLAGKLNISTLHASKGLEYTDVYILDLNENIIPHEKSLTEAQIEEERRMLYVGMTRAKEHLHLFSVRERYGRSLPESRFIKEMKL